MRSRKQLGVLVYLAVDGRERPVARDGLMEAFWPDAAPERAYHSLCQAVTAIRRALRPDAVIGTSDGLRLGPGFTTDVEALAQDLDQRDLTHPLDGMDWWGGPALGHWLARARTQCMRVAADALRAGIGEFRRLGATQRVHRCAELLYVLDPHSEPAVLALAERAMLRSDVVGAIRLLRTHEERVREDLGCNPQPAVARLRGRLEAGAHPSVDLVPKRLASRAAQVRPALVVARERELAHLEGEWQRVSDAGALRACIVSGQAGIGKTSLLRRFATTVAGRAQTVFLVSCQEMGAAVPYAAVTDLVLGLLRDPAVSGTDPAALAEVSRINPMLRQRFPGVPVPVDAPADTILLRIADGVMHMLESVTEGAPTAVLFDDVQHMDAASREVLTVLVRRCRDLPVFLVATFRSHGPDAALIEGPFDREPTAWKTRLPLEPLGREGTRRLIEALAPSLAFDQPGVVQRITELAEGNPQFTEMLLADWEEHATASLAAGRSAEELPADWEPPASLRHAFARLYTGLSQTAQRLLHVLAVAQRALTSEELGEAIGHGDEIDQAALELLTRGILRLDEGALRFKNELHRAYVYFSLKSEVHKYIHLRLGQSILRASPDGDFDRGFEAAHHLILAGQCDQAIDVTESTARIALTAGAAQETEKALLRLEKCTIHPTSPTVGILLAEAQLNRAKPLECLSTLSTIRLEGATDREASEASLVRLRAEVGRRATAETALVSEISQLIADSSRAGYTDITIAAIQLFLELCPHLSRPEQLQAFRGRLERLKAGASTSHEQVASGLALGFISLARGEFDEARATLREVVEAELGRSVPILWRVLNGLGLAETALGNFHEAERILKRIERETRDVTTLPNPVLWSNIAVVLLEKGELEDASSYLARALESLQENPEPRAHLAVLTTAASFALCTGHLDLTAKCLELADVVGMRSTIQRDRLDTQLVRCDYHLALGQDEVALETFEEHVLPLGERSFALGEAARHERLMSHYLRATRGSDAYAGLCRQRQARRQRLPLSGRVELQCFDDWVMGNTMRPEIEALVLQGKCIGAVLQLGAVGALPAEAHSTSDTNAGRAGAFVKALCQEVVQASLDWPLPTV